MGIEIITGKWAGTVRRALAVAAAGIACARAGEITSLPTFTLPDLDGKQWSSSQFLGKPLVVDFWATWCTTCKETIPKLAELCEKYKGRNLTVLGISVDKGSDEKIRKAAKKMGINYLVLHDQDNSLGKTFGFSGIPSVFVFDRRGKLMKAMPGYDPDQEDQLAAATAKAL
jgi:peroxiredoxin